jgi:predicted nucleic acid-binding protein
MIVVADSGPLHYLILLEHVDLLRCFYGQVLVPEPVASELSAAGAPGVVREWITKPPTWVDVRPLTPEAVSTITNDLDLGQRAAIALAETMHADLLLIDEAAGRAEAKRRHLRVTGTLGVLRTGAEQGLVNVPDVLECPQGDQFLPGRDVFERGLRSVAEGIENHACAQPPHCFSQGETAIRGGRRAHRESVPCALDGGVRCGRPRTGIGRGAETAVAVAPRSEPHVGVRHHLHDRQRQLPFLIPRSGRMCVPAICARSSS